MEPFFISPSEALLLGVCLEEYLCIRRGGIVVSFFHLLQTRIHPFCPNLTQVRLSKIAERDFPPDIQWLPISDMKVGISKKHPNTFFGIDDNGSFVKKTIDASRKNLESLLALYLRDHVGQHPALRQLDQGTDIASQANELLSAISYGGDLDIEVPNFGINPDEDNVVEIERRVKDLIAFNELQHLFSLGGEFGAIIGSLQLYESARSPLLCMSELKSALLRLNEAPEVAASSLGKCVLESVVSALRRELEALGPIWKVLEEVIGRNKPPSDLRELAALVANIELTAGQQESFAAALDKDEQKTRRQNVLPLIERIRPAIWVAFGELLGFVRTLDQETRQQDASQINPRSFMVSTGDTPDKIRHALAASEHELAMGIGDKSSPERVVFNLSVAIETLAKRIWKREFASNRDSRINLPSILREKLWSTDTREKRFACIGLNLYMAYRNDAVHNFDNFICTLSEARFFISGIRSLLELFESLNSNQK